MTSGGGEAGGVGEPGRDAAEVTAPRPRMNADKIETWVDQAIQQAQRRGDFDDLPGAGKPLPDLDRGGDPDWWVKNLIEREKLDLTGAMPPAMALRRERSGFPESLLHLRDEAAVRERLDDFNARVLADRRRPWAGPGSPPVVGRVDVAEMLRSWAEAKAAQARDARSGTSGDAGEALDERSENAGASTGAHDASDVQGRSRTPRRWWRRTR